MSNMVISPAAKRIMDILVGRPPQTVTDLIRATHVTRTAVTEQLNELVEAGLVQRRTERLPGRGRPRHLYSATFDALLRLFARHERLVVPAIWRAIEDVGGPELTRKVLRRVTKALAEHYRPQIDGKTPGDRLVQMAALLHEEGVVLEVEEDNEGHVLMRKRSCPFIGMFEEHRTVCCLDQDVTAAVVGAPVTRIECRHDGDPCCTFQVHLTNGK